MDYVDLHAHSHFSFGDGTFSPKDMVERAKGLGRKALALTDHENVSGHAEFERAAVAAGIKPIFGVESYFVYGADRQRQLGKSKDKDEKAQSRKRFHMGILARNVEGYKNLLAGVTDSSRDNFYYKALWDVGVLERHHSGLVVLSGCLSSPISQPLLEGNYALARERAIWFKELLGEDYYLEAQLFDFEKTRMTNAGVLQLGKELGIKVVATNDVHQRVDSDKPLRQLVHCLRDQRKWGEPASNDYQELTEYQLDDDEILLQARLSGLEDVIYELAANTVEVADKCNVEIPKSEFLKFPLPPGEEDAARYLYGLIKEGVAQRGIDLGSSVYRDRLLYETNIIESKGFVDYFLVVRDVVQWAKRRGILVGPGRGSAAGSLLSYVLGITNVDPIRYGLMFERFIDVDRIDFPDIDIDFDQERRDEVHQYFRDKYGADRVAMLGTFMMWRSKSSLDAIGRVYSIPQPTIDEVKSELGKFVADDEDDFDNAIEIVFDKSPRVKEILQVWPDLQIAKRLEGQMRTLGTHPCGVILSNRELRDTCALYFSNGEAVTSVNGDNAEYLGLLKIDVLGLSTLTVMRQCMEAAGVEPSSLYEIAHDDPETIKGFNDGDVLGVFQFEGYAMRQVLDQMPNITSLMELSHICALCRPGPLDSGITADFLKSRMGYQPPQSIHPVIDEKLGWTYGYVIYQEQITQLAMLVGGMSGGRADQLRKAVSKKYGADVINSMREEFVAGATQRGVDGDIANHLFDQLLDFGRYAFNLSHSIAYALMSYYSMYLKKHYPTEFYAALLSNEKEEAKRIDYLREWVSRGGRVLPPHYNKSQISWKAEGKNVIRAGFDAIKGIGDKVAERLYENQPYKSPEDLKEMRVKQPTENSPERVALIVTAPQFESLQAVGAFDDDPNADFMGLSAFSDAIEFSEWERKANSVGSEEEGEIIVAGAVSDRQIKSRYEQNLRYGSTDEVNKPEFDEYMSFVLTDDSGSLPITIGRMVWPRYRKLMTEKVIDGDIVTVIGNTNDTIGKRVMAGKILPMALKFGEQYVSVEEINANEAEVSEANIQARRDALEVQKSNTKLRSRVRAR